MFSKMIATCYIPIFNLGYLSYYCQSSLIILSSYKSFSRSMICKKCSPSPGLAFSFFLIAAFWSAKVFSFFEVCLSKFFMDPVFNVLSKNSLPNERSWRLSAMFTFKCMLHSKWTLCVVWGKSLNYLSFLMWISRCPSTTCWKDDPFPIELPQQLCQKATDHNYKGLILDSQEYSMIYISIYMHIIKARSRVEYHQFGEKLT